MNRGPLAHDDRIDAVAGAVAHFQRAMMMDVDQAAKAMRDEEMLAEIEDFLEGFNQPTYRGMRINGQRVAKPGHPEMGGPGTACPMPSGCTEPLGGVVSSPSLPTPCRKRGSRREVYAKTALAVPTASAMAEAAA